MTVRRDAIASDHHERVGQRLSHRAIRNLEDHDGGPLPAQSRETGAGQAFASGGIQDIVISDTHALLPPRIEHSRLQRSGSRGVVVGLGGDIEAALARAAYDLE